MGGTASAMAILDALNASGFGDLLKGAIGKAKDSKSNKMKATLQLISVIVDSMDETGKCDGKILIKELLDEKQIFEDDNESEF